MYVHTRERDSRPGFDGVKIKLFLLLFIFYGKTVPETLLDRVVSMGESPTKRAFNPQHVPKTSVTNNDGLVDSIRHLLFTDNFTKPYSHEHRLVHLLTTAL